MWEMRWFTRLLLYKKKIHWNWRKHWRVCMLDDASNIKLHGWTLQWKRLFFSMGLGCVVSDLLVEGSGLDLHEDVWPSYVAYLDWVSEFGVPRSSYFLPRWTKIQAHLNLLAIMLFGSFYCHGCICEDSSQLALESSLVPHMSCYWTNVFVSTPLEIQLRNRHFQITSELEFMQIILEMGFSTWGSYRSLYKLSKLGFPLVHRVLWFKLVQKY